MKCFVGDAVSAGFSVDVPISARVYFHIAVFPIPFSTIFPVSFPSQLGPIYPALADDSVFSLRPLKSHGSAPEIQLCNETPHYCAETLSLPALTTAAAG